MTRGSTSRSLMATAICAALYAVGCYSTAYIPSPWGFGQFRPAVIIPALFATIFGPLPAAVGAAIGTLIADSVKHGCLYLGSLIAAVPGNFLGFYLFGWILQRRFTWSRFIAASHLTLTLANLLVAALYILVFKVLYLGQLRLPLNALIFLIFGLTIWWFVTMLPFVLLVTPPLIRAVASAYPSLVPEEVAHHTLREEIPERWFALSMIIPGVAMVLLGFSITGTGLGAFISGFFGSATRSLVEAMTYLSGGALTLIGALFLLQRSR